MSEEKIKKEVWIVTCDEKPILQDYKTGKYWIGGNGVFIPAFENRKQAIALREKLQRKWRKKPYASKSYNTKKIIIH